VPPLQYTTCYDSQNSRNNYKITIFLFVYCIINLSFVCQRTNYKDIDLVPICPMFPRYQTLLETHGDFMGLEKKNPVILFI
jgi:hypothetical protein